jgi:hypothetical protein
MKRLAICIFALMIGTSCVETSSSKQPKKSEEISPRAPVESSIESTDKNETLTIFFTGNELGSLKPCGCSGGQLGGLDRRTAIFDRASEQSRLIIDTGSLVKNDAEQDLIKFNIIIQAFGLLDYDLVSLSEKDIEIGRNLGLLDGTSTAVNMISSNRMADLDLPVKFTKELTLKDKTITVTVVAFDPKSELIEQVRELFPKQRGGRFVNILILSNYDPTIKDSIAENVPFVDCIVCPVESDEPMLISDVDAKPLAFSVGRFGRHVCGLRITENNKSRNGLKLSFFDIPVTEDLAQQESLIQLYSDYQQIVKQHNLLEKYPRFTLPDGLKYANSDSCAYCHEYEYIEWMNQPHAKAFSTLEEVGSQYDPECVICHVIGMDYESGYISESKTPLLKDVGCENCHGPGSAHNENPEILTTIQESNSICITCHTPEHSNDYAGNEEEKLQLIKHWREPNEPSNVK